MTKERVQKILARTGIGSRRNNEKYIQAGRVTVNGKVIKLGDKANPDIDEIRLDGRLINKPEKFEYFALYKPRGVISTSQSPDRRKTVVDLVPHSTRVYPVGRLDIESEGLVLLTNDGELTNLLTHPRYKHDKEYRVLVAKHPDDKQLETWQRGVILDDGFKTAPAKVIVEKTKGKGAWLQVILSEGHKRQIREVARQIGLPVVKLIRIRISTLQLGSLKPRQWRKLTAKEISALKKGAKNITKHKNRG
ncbi:MAG: rRNA pseudouridine synthase [Chloroflexi bacterium]|nr:rRNA pseudouridine synthase [Chloroflexota bacterium]